MAKPKKTVTGMFAALFDFGTGWKEEPPEIRSCCKKVSDPEIQELLTRDETYRSLERAPNVSQGRRRRRSPVAPDLSPLCTEVENQGSTHACSACATVSLFEYFIRKHMPGDYKDLSIRYLYKVAREDQSPPVVGDRGVFLSTAMKCMRTRGVAPEADWKFDPAKIDEVPPVRIRALARTYMSHLHYLIDDGTKDAEGVMDEVQRHLRCGWPCTIGFPIYKSLKGQVMAGVGADGGKGHVGMPPPGDPADSGHAVLLVGYDDGRYVGGSKGAFKFRNSWGKDWGDGGYGWLPYQYLLQGVARDAWSLTDALFIQSAMA